MGNMMTLRSADDLVATAIELAGAMQADVEYPFDGLTLMDLRNVSSLLAGFAAEFIEYTAAKTGLTYPALATSLVAGIDRVELQQLLDQQAAVLDGLS